MTTKFKCGDRVSVHGEVLEYRVNGWYYVNVDGSKYGNLIHESALHNLVKKERVDLSKLFELGENYSGNQRAFWSEFDNLRSQHHGKGKHE